MTEACVGPALRVVTAIAVGTTTAFVDIVVLVTAEAGARRFHEGLVRMATKAVCLQVPTQQHEIGGAVIELDFPPTVFTVAVSTLGTHGCLMDVFVCMA